ncbi:AAWKG family protein [Streptomyces sp. MC1]|uniref:AAWKG family protein n=1 Tax=Streptomyces sp. MC1 TaxID=295105 RepID=UPI0018C9E10B|nr:AAWKG family protein [Streptomyces sp. MC1]MBG7700136.1 AAWKG family protein [Streptomyces sp. MC1]
MAAQSWEDILHLLTGWSLVKRDDVTKASGDSGIPWVNVSLKRGGTTFNSADDRFALIEPLGSNKGWHFEFFMSTGFIHKARVDINYLDNPAFHRFWGDSDGVLSSLVSQYSSLKGDISARGDGAPAVDGVQLKSFAALAWSFDAAGDFFRQQTAVLDEWKKELGSEQASWKGNAAGAFWLLVDDLHKKYENYTSQLQPPGFSPQHRSPSTGYISKTLHGDDLIGAEQALYKAYQDLYKIYSDFYWQRGQPITVTRPDGSTAQQQIPADPLDVMNQVFIELANWIIDKNVHTIDAFLKKRDGQFLEVSLEPGLGWTQTTVWGALGDTSTWHGAVNEAVSRWTKNVETNLDTGARQVLQTLQKDWSRVLDPAWNPAFSFSDTSSTLTSDVQQENTDKGNSSLDDNLKKLGDGLDNLNGGLNDGFKGLGDGLNNSFSSLGDGLNNSFSSLGNGLSNVGNGLSDSLSDITHGAADGAIKNLSTTGLGGADGDAPTYTPMSVDGGIGGGLPDTSTLLGAGGSGGGLPDTSTLLGPGGATPFGSGLPISNIDGSVTTGTANGAITSYPNGSKVTRNADGSVTSTFPDGTSQTITPDGEVTTVDPQGVTTTSHLGVGESLSHPDGTSITRNGDGSLTQTAADGTKTTTFPNGTSEIVKPGGETQLTSPDGTVSHVNADGSLTTDRADGSTVTVHPNGDVTTVDAHGATTTSHLGSGDSITNPDGSTITVDGKGDIVTHNPDGSTTTLHPDGSVTTTDGTSTTTSGLNGGRSGGSLDLPSVHFPTDSGGSVTYTPDGTAITTRPDGTTEFTHADGSGVITASDGRFQTIPSPQTSAAAAARTAAAEAAATGAGAGTAAGAMSGAGASDSQNAMGLLSPMMMMAGMNRMGGQQGNQQGGGDRERQLYDGNDMDGAVYAHGGPAFAQQGAPAEDPEEWEEEETDSDELLGPRRPSTESAYGPGGPRQATQSAWSGNGKDVWGTEEGGLPASIGH